MEIYACSREACRHVKTATNRESWAGLVGVGGAAGEVRARGRVNEGHAENTNCSRSVHGSQGNQRRYTYNKVLNWAFSTLGNDNIQEDIRCCYGTEARR